MKQITKKEFDTLEFLSKIRAVSKWHKVFSDLPVGVGVVITNEEWQLKTIPRVYCRFFKKNKLFEMKCRRLKDESGWACLKIRNIK